MDVLTGSGFNPQERSFFSWLGVLVDMTPEAATDTLSPWGHWLSE